MFQIHDVEHWEWFIVGLLPHIWVSLIQWKVKTQVGVVDIVMHLEVTPRGEEISIGLAQVQSQLANMKMQLHDMTKENIMHEHVW